MTSRTAGHCGAPPSAAVPRAPSSHSTAMPRLTDQLPPPPASLDRTCDAELRALTEQALRRQRSEVAQAIDAALAHVPLPLRGVVRRALGA